MRVHNEIPTLNRDMRRKVERYQRKHPELTFTQAYNKLYGTNYDEPQNTAALDTSFGKQRRESATAVNFN